MSDVFLLLIVPASVIASVGCVVLFALVLHWGRRRDSGLLPYLFYMAVAIVMLGVMLSGRRLDLAAETSLIETAKPPVLQLLSKVVSLFLLFAAAERIMNALLRLRPAHHVSPMLFMALALFYVTNVVSASVLATYPSYSNEYLYAGAAAVAALFATPRDNDKAIAAMRNASLVLLVLSAVFLLWNRELVLGSGYQGLIPGLTVRYAGLTNSPNALGGFVVVFLLCLWSAPFRQRALTIAAWTFGGGSLLFSQSKTSWISFLLCSAFMWHFRRERGDEGGGYPAKVVIVLIPCLMAIFTVGIILLSESGTGKASVLLQSRAGSDLLTFVGRTVIWDVAIEEWRNNPLFGYGLTIWDSDFRSRVGMPDALHAHNQFFQSLSSAGAVGVAGLVMYLAALLWLSLKTARASGGLSIAIFGLVFIRSLSEVPLSMTGYGMEQLTHLLLLIVIASHLFEERAHGRMTLAQPKPAAFAG